ncbi:RAP domain/IstB-like ATP-binding protein [Sesbania bispinosa]|nr:RAP domain/IstB-like ATP-binding protein [Sesbania bispinosa]
MNRGGEQTKAEIEQRHLHRCRQQANLTSRTDADNTREVIGASTTADSGGE